MRIIKCKLVNVFSVELQHNLLKVYIFTWKRSLMSLVQYFRKFAKCPPSGVAHLVSNWGAGHSDKIVH
jgi:hypothetical protein